MQEKTQLSLKRKRTDVESESEPESEELEELNRQMNHSYKCQKSGNHEIDEERIYEKDGNEPVILSRRCGCEKGTLPCINHTTRLSGLCYDCEWPQCLCYCASCYDENWCHNCERPVCMCCCSPSYHEHLDDEGTVETEEEERDVDESSFSWDIADETTTASSSSWPEVSEEGSE